jgi:hypothetical protein
MDYYNKYLKYKTKYLNLKYDNNQYGGENKFICLPDPEGRYPTYGKCNTVRNVSFKSDEDAPNPALADSKIKQIKAYLDRHNQSLSPQHEKDLIIDINFLFNTYSPHKIARLCNTSYLTGATHHT